jgi:hypothetical protein
LPLCERTRIEVFFGELPKLGFVDSAQKGTAFRQERAPPAWPLAFHSGFVTARNDAAYAIATASSNGNGSTSSPLIRAFHDLPQFGQLNVAIFTVGIEFFQESVSRLGNMLPKKLQSKCGHLTR